MFIDTVHSDESAPIGLYVKDVRKLTTSGVPGANTWGLGVQLVRGSSTGDATGLVVDSVEQSANTTGIRCTNINADLDSVGMSMNTVTGLAGKTLGIDIGSVLGATNSTGIRVQQVTAGTDTAKGIFVSDVISNKTGGAATTVSGIEVLGVRSDPLSAPLNNAYGLFLSRIGNGTKGVNEPGLLAKLLNGNLGLSVQYLDPGQNIENDAGNLVVLSATGVNALNPPAVGWETGNWYLICRAHAAGHLITIAAPYAFNGQAPGAAWAMPAAGGFGFTLMFYYAPLQVWYVRNF